MLVEPLITESTTINASTPTVMPRVEIIETKEIIWLFLRVRVYRRPMKSETGLNMTLQYPLHGLETDESDGIIAGAGQPLQGMRHESPQDTAKAPSRYLK